jgi:hypothetical protein
MLVVILSLRGRERDGVMVKLIINDGCDGDCDGEGDCSINDDCNQNHHRVSLSLSLFLLLSILLQYMVTRSN